MFSPFFVVRMHDTTSSAGTITVESCDFNNSEFVWIQKKKTLIIHRMSLVEWVLLCHHRADKGEFFWLFFFPQASPLQVLRLLLCSHTADQWDFENYEFVWFKNILSTTWPYESDVVSLAVSSLSWLIWLFLKDVFKQTCVTTIDGTDNSDSLLCVYCGMTRCDMTHGDMTSCNMTRALFHDSNEIFFTDMHNHNDDEGQKNWKSSSKKVNQKCHWSAELLHCNAHYTAD